MGIGKWVPQGPLKNPKVGAQNLGKELPLSKFKGNPLRLKGNL